MRRNLIKSLAIPLTLFLLVATTVAATFTGPGFAIVDNGGFNANGCSAIAVAGFVGSGKVTSVSYIGLTHTWMGDLQFRLYPPGVTPGTNGADSFMLASPPDERNCNLSGNYRFIDSASTTLDVASNGCNTLATDNNVIPAGDYRTSTYGGATTNGSTTSLSTSPGTLTAAQINGSWSVCAFDFSPGDTGSVTSTQIVLSNITTAATVSISGRVLTPGGSGVRNAAVSVRDAHGVTRTAFTNAFGYYTLDNVEQGNYVLSVSARGLSYATRVLSVNDQLSNIDFTPIQ